MPVPVILDCDPGHDDVFALWLAAGNSAIDLRAITTVGGNGRLANTTFNARVACTVAGIEVPIAAGADQPLLRTLQPGEGIHGTSALDGPELPTPTVEQDRRLAWDLIRDTLDALDASSESSEAMTVIATGPLTNIATFVRAYPDRLSKIREIVWMGGSTGRGNITPYAEFNSWVDPEAVDIVLRCGLPFTMVGLNVTHQVLVTDDVVGRIANIGNETSAFGVELLDFFRTAYDAEQGMPDAPLHDPVTVALIAEPSIVSSVRTRLDIELHGTETAGATSVDLLNTLKREPNATVAVGIDVDRFWDLVYDAIRVLR